jgi:hypothetical protein
VRRRNQRNSFDGKHYWACYARHKPLWAYDLIPHFSQFVAKTMKMILDSYLTGERRGGKLRYSHENIIELALN